MSMSNTTKRVKEIRRNTRRKFSSEEKIRIVLDGLLGESLMGRPRFGCPHSHALRKPCVMIDSVNCQRSVTCRK